MQWYYAVNGQQKGPVEEEELFALGREGRLGADDLVWNATFGDQWVKASTVAGLTVSASAPVEGVEAWIDAASYASATHNRDLMAQARACLESNWGLAVGVVAVNFLIGAACGSVPIVGSIVNLLITGPLTLGLHIFVLAAGRQRPLAFGMLFDGFRSFGTALAAYLLVTLFVLLWTLLLIVPGILASLSYSMTFFILADDPTLAPMEAIRRSKRMMAGNRWKYFCLQWRFFGWGLLCVLTLGIGCLWLWPYMMTSNARFYDDLRAGAA
jgi:uncharacterized membrane protein